jgi:murein L,D-transpeptidase YcbB/YkuD
MNTRSKTRFLATAIVLLASCAAPPAPAQPDAAAILQARIGQLRNGVEVGIDGQSIASTVVLPEFYEQREFRPAWRDPRNLDALLAAVRDSRAEGLDPEDYHLSALARLRALPPGKERDVDLDLLATDALIRLGYHLRFGKVDMATIDPHWNFRRDYEAVRAAAPAAMIQRALDAGTVAEELEALRPRHSFYAGLRKALDTYQQIQAAGGWQPLPSGPSLKPGATDPRVPALRERLLVEGDLDAEAGEGDVYDAALVAALQGFQERHGLKPDGVLGRRTLRALNVPVARRIDQIRLSLDRSRQLLHDLPDRLVVVNVPAFRVYYADSSGLRFAANAVVGKLYAQTPIFRAEITHVVLNPSWVVPPGILERDILPGLRKDPDYLRKKGLKRVGGQIVQDPGPNNALGRIKLMFPNPHLVYLHDTPEKDLLEAEGRTFSSGCIRVQNVFDLAALVIDDPDNWSKEKLLAAADTGVTRTIVLERKVPVLLTYWTAVVAPDGRVYFYEDVYGRDPANLAALDAPFKFARDAVRAAGGR